MPNKRPLRSKLLIAAVLAFSIAHGSTPLTNPRVRQLGEMLHCMCGCNASVTSCNMINCHFSDPVRHKLLTMVEAGRSDSDILAEMEREYGKQILSKPPAEGFYLLSWLMPYVGLGAGFAMILLLIRFYFNRRPAAAGGAPDTTPEASELKQYRDRIEKDLSDIES